MIKSDWFQRSSSLTRRRFVVGTGVAAAGSAAILAGCGDDSSGSAKSTAGTSPQAGASPQAAKPKEGGTFRWELTYPIIAFVDPHQLGATGGYMWQFAGNVAVRWNAIASALTPELISAWETVDGMTYVATAPDGIKTHNVPLTKGRLWDAEDIAANLMRISGLSDPSRVTSYNLRGTLPNLDSARAIDAKHVQVKFSKPTPFPFGLTNYLATFLPRENFSSPDILNDPMKVAGTGPWIPSDFRTGESITLKRNPDYWGGGSPAGPASPPHIEQIILRNAGDRVSQLSSFIQGTGTYFENPSKVERDTIAKSVSGSQLFAWPGSSVAFMKFNTLKPPFDDPRVRKAMHLATNYAKNEEDYWGKGFYTLFAVLNNAFADGIQPDDVAKLPGWRPDKTADIKDANQLLTAAGFPGGQGLSFKYTNLDGPTYQAYGVDFSVRQMDNWRQAFPKIDVTSALVPDLAALGALKTSKNYQVTTDPNIAASPASVEFSQLWTTGGALNITGYSNPRVDDLASKSVQSFDAAQATQLLKDAQAIVIDDVPGTGLHRLTQAGIYQGSVKGFPIVPGGTKPLEGSFENWNSVNRHTAVLWLDS